MPPRIFARRTRGEGLSVRAHRSYLVPDASTPRFRELTLQGGKKYPPSQHAPPRRNRRRG